MKLLYTKVIKPYFFIILATFSLLMPDFMLRQFLEPGVFSEQYVSTATTFFSIGWALFLAFLCCLILPKKIGKTLLAVLTLSFSVLAVSECVYYKIFDQFFWLNGIALAGEGADYFSYAVKLIEPRMIFYTVLAIILMLCALFTWQRSTVKMRYRLLMLLLPLAVLFGTHLSMQPELHGDASNEWDVWRKPRIVYKNFNDVNKSLEISGIYQFCYLDLYTGLFPQGHNLSTDDRSKADEFFATQSAPAKNRYTGILKGKNVIAVMMESMDTWMIDEENTPTIHNMMKNGIHFTNYNAPFFGVGFTLSSEFAFNTGFYTPVSASSASNFSGNTFPYALANLFKDAGYTTNSFHFNSSEFYNRGLMHKTYGYEKYNAAADFEVSGVEAELDSNLIKNDAFYEKMVEKTPFFNFFITYSAHLPYKGNSEKLALAKTYWQPMTDEEEVEESEEMNETAEEVKDAENEEISEEDKKAKEREEALLEKENARLLAKDTDEFFRILLERLEADGLLDDTIIVAYTDHFAYGISNSAMLQEWKGDTLSYCVPAFIYGTELQAQKITKPMMTIDWAPTLVNLFGLSEEARYLGHDALGTEGDGLVYFETGAWMDEKMHYMPTKSTIPTEEEFLHIQKQTRRVKESIQINDIVVLGDYYKEK